LASRDEVVLWFDDDLFCQLHLVHILTLLRERPGALVTQTPPPETRTEAALAAVLAARQPVSPARLALAGAVWAAYSAPDPRPLERLWRDGDFSAWPLLRRGLGLHLERFPSVATGLNPVEEAATRAALDGPLPFPAVFHAVSADERVAAHGLGDHQLAVLVETLTRGAGPLLHITGRTAGEWDGSFASWQVRAAERARAVLAGEEDGAMRAGDRWLGGVTLPGGAPPAWRWDADGQRLVGDPV
jgi:hypothetical protein